MSDRKTAIARLIRIRRDITELIELLANTDDTRALAARLNAEEQVSIRQLRAYDADTQSPHDGDDEPLPEGEIPEWFYRRFGELLNQQDLHTMWDDVRSERLPYPDD